MPNFGWIDAPAEVGRVVAELPMPVATFGISDDTDPNTDTDGYFFFEAEEKVLGHTLPANDQDGIGSCVGEGFSRNILDLMFNMIVLDGIWEFPPDLPTDWPCVSVEAVYGASRVEIGGGRINGDGSIGAWAAKAVSQIGILFYGRDYNNGAVKLAPKNYAQIRSWGNKGMPNDLEDDAKERLVQTVSLVTSGRDCYKLNRSGFPTPICSNQGFKQVRNSDGTCTPQGSWAHCMGTCGAGVLKGKKPVIAIRQSWGASGVTGPNKIKLESGRELVLPEGVFLVHLEDVERRMLSADDTFALSNFMNFPKRRPKWYT